MWLKSVHLKNIKSFADSERIEFSSGINLLVGPNNAGKSNIIRAISLLQPLPNHPDGPAFISLNQRHASRDCDIELELAAPNKVQLKIDASWDIRNWDAKLRYTKDQRNAQTLILAPNGNLQPITPILCQQKQPDNFLFTYFSRRKPAALHEAVNLVNAQSIEETLQHLPSKIDYLSSSRHGPAFNEVCQKTIGFAISAVQSAGGKQVGLVLEDESIIPVTGMGEGTFNILVFLVHLASASGKLFLIEEIENDLHPTALKHLLSFIIEKSDKNQFIISTHSNIVARYLGIAPNSKMFAIQMRLEENTKIPTSTCQPVGEDAEDRIRLLESLGYEPFDFYLWKGYLILEESTAERLIRDFFVPFLVPNLRGKLRTIAAQGVDDVEARLSDLLRLFVFIHTAPQYKERAWVAVDGGGKGEKLISNLKQKFPSWPPHHFRHFTAENFEEYYPPRFKVKAAEILAMPNDLKRQHAKGKLAEEVLQWALTDPVVAQGEFKSSAKEVLDFLGEIGAKLA